MKSMKIGREKERKKNKKKKSAYHFESFELGLHDVHLAKEGLGLIDLTLLSTGFHFLEGILDLLV